jgi:hypothetical protein
VTDFDLVKFDPGDEAQAAFVFQSFEKSTTKAWPFSEMSHTALRRRLKRELAAPNTTTVVITPKRQPTNFLGWLSLRASERTIVYGFVKYAARRMGVATSAALALGLDFLDGPTGLRFWTPAAARIARDHQAYGIFFDTTDGFDSPQDQRTFQ